jgi:hypothetical protein
MTGDGVAVMFDRPLTLGELNESFTGAQIFQPWAKAADHTDVADDHHERWPRPVRTAIAVGSAIALWVLIFYAISFI